MMKNKKGLWLASKTIEVILAVICILFLVIVLFEIYSSYMLGIELQQAKSSLDVIQKGMNEAEAKGVGGTAEAIILYPERWIVNEEVRGSFWITNWPAIGESGEIWPSDCLVNGWKFCVCICKAPDTLAGAAHVSLWMSDRAVAEQVKANCEGMGKCINATKRVNLDSSSIKIDGVPYALKITNGANKFDITRK